MKSISQENFDSEVMQDDDTVVIVDFWAEWCGPCKVLGPTLDELEKDLTAKDKKIKIVKVNVDENSGLASKYGIRGIPTMLFFHNKQVKKTLVGNHDKATIEKTASSIE